MHANQISVSDTLAKFFPSTLNFPNSPSGQLVTIKEIATHSSEFPRYPDNLERIDPHPISGYSREDMLQGIELVSIDTTIGVRYQYSNFGYGVLGVAMERLTGMTLTQLMDKYIFSKYGMGNSSLTYRHGMAEMLATPYLEVRPPVTTDPWNMEAMAGAGNLFSSVADLTKFMIAAMQEGEINNLQQKKYFKINDTWSYGLGCFIVDSQKYNTEVIYHGGDIDGYASELSLYPAYDLGIVILTNWGEGPVIGEAFTAINQAVLNHFLGVSEDQ